MINAIPFISMLTLGTVLRQLCARKITPLIILRLSNTSGVKIAYGGNSHKTTLVGYDYTLIGTLIQMWTSMARSGNPWIRGLHAANTKLTPMLYNS